MHENLSTYGQQIYSASHKYGNLRLLRWICQFMIEYSIYLFSNENTTKQYHTMIKWCIVIFWSEIWKESIKYPCDKSSISRSSYNMVSVTVQTNLFKSMIFMEKVKCVPIIYYIILFMCPLLLMIGAGQTSCWWLFGVKVITLFLS